MFTLSCPKCQMRSYSSDEISFSPCPYCGFIFSRRYGSDRRQKERIKEEKPIGFSYREQYFEASTMDFSEEGLSINIFGEPPVAVGDTLDLTVGDHQIRAKAMWINKLPNKFMVGLQKLN